MCVCVFLLYKKERTQQLNLVNICMSIENLPQNGHIADIYIYIYIGKFVNVIHVMLLLLFVVAVAVAVAAFQLLRTISHGSDIAKIVYYRIAMKIVTSFDCTKTKTD